MSDTPPAAGANNTQTAAANAAAAAAVGFSGGGAGSAAGGGQQAQQPGITVSPYEYQLLEADRIFLGATMASLLGIPSSANTAVAASTVLQDYLDLPSTKQFAFMQMLYAAGFWINAQGAKPETQIDFNGTDPDNQNAVSMALLTTSNKNLNVSKTGSTLSSVVQAQIASGAGAQETTPTPAPQTGGANIYQVTLTSPADLYNTLYSTWESTLGYAPDQKTLDKYVQVFQGEQSKYQQALNAQQENQAYTKFQQARSARNTQQNFLQIPAVAGGPVPKGPFATPAAWASAFVTYLATEGVPYTSSNVAYILSIINKLGTWDQASKTFNPLGAQAPLPGQVVSKGTPNPNAPLSYANWSDGMQGALDQLAKAPGVLDLLLSGNASDPKVQAQYEENGAAAGISPSQELSTWTNGKVKGVITAKPGERAAADHVAAVSTRQTAKAKATPTIKAGLNQPVAAPAGALAPQQPESANAATAPTPPATIPNDQNTPEYRATHPPTGPGFSTAAISPTAAAAPPGPTDLTGKSFNVPAPGTPGAANPLAKNAGAPEEPSIAEAIAKAKAIRAQATSRTLPTPNIPNTPAEVPVSGLNTQAQQLGVGDSYIGSNTLVGTTPPSASGLAFTQATTGANQVPYQGNEYLAAFNTIADMIARGTVAA